VGFERLDNDLRPLYCEHAFHISFPPAYLPGEARPLWQRTHPTWHLEGSATSPLPFGGVGKGACGVCGNGLHHLLTLDPVPDGLPVTGLSRLSLSVCLSCYGWERPAVFYQHGQDGEPQNIGYEGPRIQPEFPTEALAQTDVWLVESDRRWRWQDWAQSSGCENLNRIGGHPCWIQDAEYPKCPHCGQTMGFLMQLEAGIPTVDGDEWLEGEGICYGFWCDSCRISAFLWQCT
jgi:hypothetical protein